LLSTGLKSSGRRQQLGGEVLIGIVEFTSEGPVPTGSVDGEVLWRSTSHEMKRALAEGPVEAIVFHVQLDEYDDLVRTLYEAKQLRPAVKMMLAGSSNNLFLVAEITSTVFNYGSRPGPDSGLSPRQVQVLTAIRSGRTNREIATHLGISLSTVNRHVENILQKLPARNRAQAAAIRYWQRP
jgi:DNA-binding NarL/FixJ family response regulator